jgi:hypothetical protein
MNGRGSNIIITQSSKVLTNGLTWATDCRPVPWAAGCRWRCGSTGESWVARSRADAIAAIGGCFALPDPIGWVVSCGSAIACCMIVQEVINKIGAWWLELFQGWSLRAKCMLSLLIHTCIDWCESLEPLSAPMWAFSVATVTVILNPAWRDQK